jgi:hypothetical protein
LRLELSFDAGCGSIEGRSHFYVRIESAAGPGLVLCTGLRQKIVLQEIDHRIGRRRFLCRSLLGSPSHDGLSGTHDNACDKNQKHCPRCCHQSFMTPPKLLELINSVRRSRHDRFIGKISADIRAQFRG